MRLLLENVLRNGTGSEGEAAKAAILGWLASGASEAEIAFVPGRVLMHDTTCVPALVDVAAMRSALAEAGGDPTLLNPVLAVDVSVDHSVAVDHYGSPDALQRNMERELGRNLERYRFMKWATRALKDLRVHPPGTGIMHTINLERLATIVTTETRDGESWAVPDTLIGTDSHTPMINGIGVLAWGVGGVEAESVLFGMPVMLRIPEVIGVRLSGRLPDGTLATDLALTVTEQLRRLGLSGQFVEFFGPGLSSLSAGDRAVVANMAPEYGASSGFFPVDEQTLAYLVATGRSRSQADLVAAYAKRQSLWFDPDATPRYTDTIEIDLGRIGVTLAGPRRPQDRLSPAQTVAALAGLWDVPLRPAGPDATEPPDGAVAIAAITSCTNTSNPRLTVAAGLLARKARRLGLTPKPWVKTSFAPGSPTAERYLRRAGLLEDLEALGFGIVGYGCTTCIGNSGPLAPAMGQAVEERGVHGVAVLSGNRNFPGRVHAQIEAGFLASPPLTVAYALAGDVNRDILTDAVAHRPDGAPVHLADLWPTGDEIDAAVAAAADPADYDGAYEEAEASEVWRKLDVPATALFPWDEASTYIRRPPFASADSRDPARPLRRASAHRPRRRHHHRPHLAGGTDPRAQRSRRPPGRARRRPPRPQRVRGAARQLGGHAARPVREPGGPQRALSRGAARRDDARAERRDPAAVARRRALPRRGSFRRAGGGRALRHRLVARLGGQGACPARRPRRPRRQLRAHPPVEPRRHGHPADQACRRTVTRQSCASRPATASRSTHEPMR